MPTYPVKNKVTGEEKELNLTMANYEQWRKDNPDWDKDWMAGVASLGEVGEVYDKLKKSHPGFLFTSLSLHSPTSTPRLGEFSGVKYRSQSGLSVFH